MRRDQLQRQRRLLPNGLQLLPLQRVVVRMLPGPLSGGIRVLKGIEVSASLSQVQAGRQGIHWSVTDLWGPPTCHGLPPFLIPLSPQPVSREEPEVKLCVFIGNAGSNAPTLPGDLFSPPHGGKAPKSFPRGGICFQASLQIALSKHISL